MIVLNISNLSNAFLGSLPHIYNFSSGIKKSSSLELVDAIGRQKLSFIHS